MEATGHLSGNSELNLGDLRTMFLIYLFLFTAK